MSNTSGKTSKEKVAEPRTNWKSLRSMTDEQGRAGLDGDPEIHPADDAFWTKANLVMPRSKTCANLEKGLNAVEAQPSLRRMMEASAADIETGRVLNTRQLRQRRKQEKKAKGSRS